MLRRLRRKIVIRSLFAYRQDFSLRDQSFCELRREVFSFNSIERCLVLDLDSRYDIILGMVWIERHEPCIDWRSKALGATRTISRGALEIHEPTSARNQKRYWREPLADNVSVLTSECQN